MTFATTFLRKIYGRQTVMDQNSFSISGIESLVKQAGPKIVHAIQKASAATGVDFAYLMEKASVESSFKPDAKAKTSSATGLFQFLDKTWMGMVKKYGDKYGMGNLAGKIDDQGNCSDPAARRQILALRKDPEKAACLAAEYDSENRQYLQDHTSGPVGPTEMYMAHFMGAGGATDFLNGMKDNPSQSAASLFPKAASTNHNVFYDQNGKPRSLAQVYDFFSQKFQGTGDDVRVADSGQSAGTVVADNAPDMTSAAIQMLNDNNSDYEGAQDAQTANALAALRKPSHLPVTLTRDAGAITWNGPRMILSPSQTISPNTMQLAMMARDYDDAGS